MWSNPSLSTAATIHSFWLLHLLYIDSTWLASKSNHLISCQTLQRYRWSKPSTRLVLICTDVDPWFPTFLNSRFIFKQHPMYRFMSLITSLVQSAETAGIASHLSSKNEEASLSARSKMVGIAKNWLEEQWVLFQFWQPRSSNVRLILYFLRYVIFLNATVQSKSKIYTGTSPSAKIKTFISALHSVKTIPNLEVSKCRPL